MTAIALPAIPGVSAVEWTLERNVATYESPLTRVAQRLARSGERWHATLRFPMYQNIDAGVLAAWLDQISRGDRWLYLTPPQNGVRGNWNPANLITNGDFVTDVTTGWTASSTTLSVNARTLKVKNSGAAQGQAYQDVTMEAAKPHVLLADGYRGISTGGVIEVHRTSGGLEYSSGTLTMPTRVVLLAAAPTVAAMRVYLWSGNAVSGDDVRYGGISLTRCLQVAGASQTGNRLNVDGGPTSVNAALRAGEFVCVKVGTLYQLVRLVEDFDSDSSGAGTLVFEPALRAAPADNDPVIVRAPFARFRIAEHQSTQSVSAPNFNGFIVEAIEDVTE